MNTLDTIKKEIIKGGVLDKLKPVLCHNEIKHCYELGNRAYLFKWKNEYIVLRGRYGGLFCFNPKSLSYKEVDYFDFTEDEIEILKKIGIKYEEYIYKV